MAIEDSLVCSVCKKDMPALPLQQIPKLVALAVFLGGGFLLKHFLSPYLIDSPELYSVAMFVLLGGLSVVSYRLLARGRCEGCGR